MDIFRNSVHFLYKSTHYLVCLAVVLLSLTSIGNLQLFVSRQTLGGLWDPDSSVLWRFLIDLGLLLLFMFQHSVMATDWLKKQLENWLHISVSQRIVYVATSCVALMFMILQWHSIPEAYLWFIDTQKRTVVWVFFWLFHVVCWLLLCLEIFIMDTGEMLGVSQVHHYHTSRRPPLLEKVKKLRDLYSRMRHPGALMLTTLLWVHPLMTLDRVLLASVLTTYMIGRHSFEQTHYTFAEKYFTEERTKKVTRSSTRYEYVKEN